MPNFINHALLADIKALVVANPSFIVLDPSRLKSGDQLKLRKSLNSAGAKMRVTKISLARIAMPAQAHKLLEGKTTIAVVAASDMIAASKIVADLEKEEKLTVRGGIMDGQPIDAAGVKKLAAMPSKQTLRGMLVNVLAAPLVGFARVIAEIQKKQSS